MPMEEVGRTGSFQRTTERSTESVTLKRIAEDFQLSTQNSAGLHEQLEVRLPWSLSTVVSLEQRVLRRETSWLEALAGADAKSWYWVPYVACTVTQHQAKPTAGF